MTDRIREATPSDKKAILDVMASHTWRGERWNWDLTPAKRYLDAFFSGSCRCLSKDMVLVLTKGDDIIGLTGWAVDRYETNNYWLGWFYVHAAHTRRGLGRKLLAHTEQELARQGVRRLFVSTSSHLFYKAALLLYQSMGYKEVGRIRGYYSSGEDQIILSKTLKNARKRSP